VGRADRAGDASDLGIAALEAAVGEAPEDRRVGTENAAGLGDLAFAGAGEGILARPASVVAAASFTARGAVDEAGPSGAAGKSDEPAEAVRLVVGVRDEGQEISDFRFPISDWTAIVDRQSPSVDGLDRDCSGVAKKLGRC